MVEINNSEFDQRDQVVERRFLLFQVNMGDPTLERFAEPRNSGDVGVPVKISDPVDYDNPASPLYWRQVVDMIKSKNQDEYNEAWNEAFTNFFNQFSKAIGEKNIKLRLADISEFVKVVKDYSVRLDSIDNQCSLTLARPTATDLAPTDVLPGVLLVDFTPDHFAGLSPQENDILVVKVRRGAQVDYEPEFIGMVTKVNRGWDSGRIDSYDLVVYGRSKVLYTTQVVTQKSINPQEFAAGGQLDNPAIPTPLADAFNNYNVKQLFDYVMDKCLGSKSRLGATVGPSSTLYTVDLDQFNSKDSTRLQHNLFVLLATYLMATTSVDGLADGDTVFKLFGGQGEITDPAVKSLLNTNTQALEQPVTGLVERGDHAAFNLMCATGFSLFYSTMKPPADVLGEIRTTAYMDLFESREGILVCRPPRFNKPEISVSEWRRITAEKSRASILKWSGASWEFNPDADFVIRSEELLSTSFSKDDSALEGRVDVKILLPLAGDTGMPMNYFADPDIILRYGLRMHGPVNNPNAYTPRLGKLFGALVLGMVNANTRNLMATVADTRKFRVGKLYYLEALDMMGYLTLATINHVPGSKSSQSLQFSMIRSVARRPIAEILKNPHEVLNVAMMYCDDFPTVANLPAAIKSYGKAIIKFNKEETGAVTLKDFVYTKGLDFLNSLLADPDSVPDPFAEYAWANRSSSSAGKMLALFKYIPGIDDLILLLESNPEWAEKPSIQSLTASADQKPNQDQRESLRPYTDGSGFIYHTAGIS